MTSSTERHKHYSLFSAPTPDSPLYVEFIKYHEQQFRNDSGAVKESKIKYKQAVSIINSQLKNGAGLIVNSEFKYFLREFNARTFEFEFGFLPSAFNVLEGFFKFNKNLFLF